MGARVRACALAGAWLLVALLAASGVFLPLGCTTGPANPGPSTGLTLEGSVVDAINPTTAIPNAYVYVPHRTISSRQAGLPEPADAFDDTDANGQFTIENIPVRDFTVKVAPPEGSNYAAPLEMEFRGITATTFLPRLRITLLLRETQEQLAFFRINPPSATIDVGDTLQFAVEAGGTDIPPTLTPTYLVQGRIGTISEDGLFTATQEGQGIVVAYLGEFMAAATVSVGAVAQISVSLTAIPASGEAPLTVAFTGSAQPADPDHPITGYRLSFGDVSAAWVSTTPPSGVSHAYTDPGLYTAVLEARDSLDRSGFDSQQVVVTTPPEQPVLSVNPTTLDFGDTIDSLTCVIRNTGFETLTWSVSGLPTWARASPSSGSGDATVTMTADRSGLGYGSYQQVISVTSNGGNASVTLRMTISEVGVIVR